MFRGEKDKHGKIVMDKEYLAHPVFVSLDRAAEFYSELADNVMCFAPKWVKDRPIVNYDTYFFEALANSIVSIWTVLELGHITDAKTLLRKFFDEIIVNLYFIARLKRKDDELLKLMAGDDGLFQEIMSGKFYDCDVSDWLMDKKTNHLQKALHYDEMRSCLKKESRIKGIVEYLDSPECKKNRKWLNDSVHLNYYKTVLINDGCICIDGARKSALDKLKLVFDKISMFHAACLFCLKPAYLMSSDYMDYVNCDMQPPDGCEDDVSPTIQSYLDETVYKVMPDWAEILVKVASPMRLRKVERAAKISGGSGFV